MRKACAESGLRHINKEEVSAFIVHETPEQYWQFMARVVAGFASAEAATRERIPNRGP
jgi:hypothetical protein